MSKTAFLFPGQGSQKVGMGKSFCENFAKAAALFQQANDVLGFDLQTLCFEGPEETLKQTENTQPALFVTSAVAYECLQETCPFLPDAVAGHSVGEYAAFYVAGVVTFEDGLRLVRKRAELMRDSAQRFPGAMTALLGAEAQLAREVCEAVRASGGGIVSVANFNGGGQIVISGESSAVEKASELAKERGVKRAIPLPVSGGFHSPLMVTAGDALFEPLSRTTLRKPKVPIVSNVSADYVQLPDDIVGGLTMQVSRSVRWEESIQRLLADGITRFVELGSGEVLTGLMKRIDKSAQAMSVQDTATLQATCNLLMGAEG